MPTKKPTVKSLQRQLDNANEALEMALSLSPERDNNFFPGGMSDLYEGRSTWDRKKIFAASLRAWRVNPIARRIVRLMTSFVIGKGLTVTSPDEKTNAFLQEWMKANKFKKNLKRWKDEDIRTGNLFPLYNVDQTGMSIIRMVPAEQIEDIETKEHDIEQETGYTKDAAGNDKWEAYDPQTDQSLFMLHFASNQPVGSPWGEADLSPLLVWIGRFSSWLEDRVRLNHFRSAFMYVVRGAYSSEAERSTREKTLRANPPQSGSLLVLNSNTGEEWGILSAQLDAFDASMDGTAIKKMVASGVGFPMHWLAEPEGSTRTTAEAAGTPTFRTLEEAQDDFFEMIIEMARVALQVRSRIDTSVDAEAEIEVSGPDITERDNATLALALGRAYPQLADLYDREGIEPEEFLRLVYKMFAEVWDKPEDEKTPKIKRKPLTAPGAGAAAAPNPGADETDPKEDEESNSAWVDDLQKFLTTNTSAPVVNITNQMPEQEAPVVNVTNEAPTINVEAPVVNVEIPEPQAAVINVANQIETPAITEAVEKLETRIEQLQDTSQIVQNAAQSIAAASQAVKEVQKRTPNIETEPALPKRKKRK